MTLSPGPIESLFERQPTLESLKVQQLHLSWPEFDLRADFEIEVGHRVALVGPSGSGKTSLLRVLAGLDPHGIVSGEIILGQSEITFDSPQSREAGYVFQDQVLFGSLSVIENVAFGLTVRGLKKKVRLELALSWLEKVGMGQKAEAQVGGLSGGERQRVALARALIWRPRYLLLDEPFSSLDQQLRDQLIEDLIGLHALWPAPMLFVTHDDRDVKSMATSQLNLKIKQESGMRAVSLAR